MVLLGGYMTLDGTFGGLYGTFFSAGLSSQQKVTYGLFPSDPNCGILLNNYETLWKLNTDFMGN